MRETGTVRRIPASTVVSVCAAALAVWLLCGAAGAAGGGKVAAKTDIVYGEAGGQRLLLDVFMPEEETTAPRPAILFVHGGGWAWGQKEDFQGRARRFAREGYVCFSANYRLVKPGGVNTHPAQIDDVQLAVRWIREHGAEYGADPRRVAAWGASAGGHLVALLGTTDTRDPSAPLSHRSSRPECVVDEFGPSDLTAAFPTSATLGINVQKLVDGLLGRPATSAPELAKEASPIYHVDPRTAPFLILQGTEDIVVPRDQSDRLHMHLKAAGIDAEYLVVEGAGHGFAGEQEERVVRAAKDFLTKHLGSSAKR
jgi:acetyl esterase/lipase